MGESGLFMGVGPPKLRILGLVRQWNPAPDTPKGSFEIMLSPRNLAAALPAGRSRALPPTAHGLPSAVLALALVTSACSAPDRPAGSGSEVTASSDVDTEARPAAPLVQLLADGQVLFGVFSGERTAEQGAAMGQNRELDFVFYSLESGPFDIMTTKVITHYICAQVSCVCPTRRPTLGGSIGWVSPRSPVGQSPRVLLARRDRGQPNGCPLPEQVAAPRSAFAGFVRLGGVPWSADNRTGARAPARSLGRRCRAPAQFQPSSRGRSGLRWPARGP